MTQLHWNTYWRTLLLESGSYYWNILNFTPGFLKKCVRLGLPDFLSNDIDGFIGS